MTERCTAISPKRGVRCIEPLGHGSEEPEIQGIERWKKGLTPQSHFGKDSDGVEWTWFTQSTSETRA